MLCIIQNGSVFHSIAPVQRDESADRRRGQRPPVFVIWGTTPRGELLRYRKLSGVVLPFA